MTTSSKEELLALIDRNLEALATASSSGDLDRVAALTDLRGLVDDEHWRDGPGRQEHIARLWTLHARAFPHETPETAAA